MTGSTGRSSGTSDSGAASESGSTEELNRQELQRLRSGGG
jgi:hypothetical protein